MKCEICGLKDAAIHIRQIEKDLVHELHICEECAQEKGLIREEESEVPVGSILAGLLEGKDLPGAPTGKDSCPSCGMKLSEFRKQGRLGCAECFVAFDGEVRAIVSQMAARPKHVGKLPRARGAAPDPSADGDHLREELRAALEQEDYEEAARLRDRLRGLDPEANGGASRDV